MGSQPSLRLGVTKRCDLSHAAISYGAEVTYGEMEEDFE
jgi:hypothetical protein